MKPSLIASALGAGLLLCGCNSPEASGVKVIVGARLLTAPDRPPIDYSVIIVQDGKFREVGPQSSTPVPKGAEITRGLGMTIEPVPGGQPIEPGRPADLVMKPNAPASGQSAPPAERVMRGGEWVQ